MQLGRDWEVSLYPNPASGFVHVELPEAGQVKEVQLYDVSGRRMEYSGMAVSENRVSIGCGNLRSGFYFLKIVTEEATYSTRFVK